MIKTLIFDMGNVIVDFRPQKIYEEATGSVEDGQILFELFMNSGIWHELDRGVPLNQVIAWTQQKAPQYLHEAIEYVIHHWHEDLILNEAMSNYLLELIPHYNTYLLSNVSSQFHDFRHRFEILDSFDGLYISADRKLLKPDQAIYLDFLEQYQLDPAECYFIDDKEENILGASEVGIQGHVYDGDLDKLKKAIVELSQ